MSYNVKTIEMFDKQAKKLAAKYPSLKTELADLIESLEENPEQGTSLGNNCYKIRLAVKSKGKGKSGGARVITSFIINDDTVYLIAIYDKSDKEDISDKELRELLNDIP